jgi:hypothetical protein
MAPSKAADLGVAVRGYGRVYGISLNGNAFATVALALE